MKNSKVWLCMSILTPKEQKEFASLLEVKFFSSTKSLDLLWSFLLEALRKQQNPPSKKDLFFQLFPNKTYDDVKIRLLNSQLLSLIETYLLFPKKNEDTAQKRIQLTQIMNQRNQPKLAQHNLQKAEKLLGKQHQKDVYFYLNNNEISNLKYQVSLKANPTTLLPYHKVSRQLDIAFIGSKLQNICHALMQQNIYRIEYPFEFLDELVSHAKHQGLLNEPFILIHYICLKMLQAPENETHFLQFKQKLIELGGNFSPKELRELYLLAINHCIKQINQGNTIYYDSVIELYEKGLENAILLERGKLSRFTYHNIATAGIKTNRMKWVETFINQYKTKLEQAYQESAFSFNQARLAYHNKQYNKALPLLQKANYKDVLLNLAAKTLLLKIYFELNELNLLDAHLEAMQNFIRRKKILGYHRSNYLNIITITRKIIEIPPFNKKSGYTLRKTITETEPLTEKQWLLDQIN